VPYFVPDLDTALEGSDAVSLHLALTADTDGLIDDRRVALPRPGYLLINTARARLVDESALLRGLADGRIGHAALDVFHVEPLPIPNAYSSLQNVTLTPHAAYLTDDACLELWRRTLKALAALA
jgi:D-3-phosphoglycerate dehydrogenase / 2-oxoglutarate reductase